MLKKYRQLFVGVIIGGLLFSAVPILAATKTITAAIDNIKVKINGTEIQTDTPIIYQNKTYLPIRAVVEKLGASVGWNGETKTVDINTETQTVTSKPTSTPDGITEIVKINNEYFISFIQVKNKIKERGYELDQGSDGVWVIKKDGNIIINNLQMNERSRMLFDYYVNTVIPITQ